MYAEARLEFDPFGPAGADYLRDARNVGWGRAEGLPLWRPLLSSCYNERACT